MSERDDAREYFKAKGLTYGSALNGKNMKRLLEILGRELDKHEDLPSLKVRGPYVLKFSAGEITASVFCDAHYFEKRQAITFEPGGFIGFAGWADDKNVQPFLSAIRKWCDEVSTFQRPIKEAAE